MSDGEVLGAPELARTLRALGDDLQDFTGTNAAVGQALRTQAAARVPNTTRRGTGALARSGRFTATKAEAVVEFTAAHASPINWGTGPRPGQRGPHNIRASLFATTPATDVGAWLPMYEDAVDTMLDKVRGVPA